MLSKIETMYYWINHFWTCTRNFSSVAPIFRKLWSVKANKGAIFGRSCTPESKFGWSSWAAASLIRRISCTPELFNFIQLPNLTRTSFLRTQHTFSRGIIDGWRNEGISTRIHQLNKVYRSNLYSCFRSICHFRGLLRGQNQHLEVQIARRWSDFVGEGFIWIAIMNPF